MDRNFARALQLVLTHEGGFVNLATDPGGATNKGITLATMRRYITKGATVDDLRRITDAQVATVYRKQYWNAVKADDLPDGVDYAVFDYGVNSGPARAIKALQTVLGVAVDGKIGPKTIEAAKAKARVLTINALCNQRLAFLRGLKTWPTFGKGWANRVTAVRGAALDMAGDAALADITSKEPQPSLAPYPYMPPTPEASAPVGPVARLWVAIKRLFS